MATRDVTPYSDFNSIKVRLKQLLEAIKAGEKIFQFHKGTIKTLAAAFHNAEICYFNSIKVRLKQQRTSTCQTSSFISIP